VLIAVATTLSERRRRANTRVSAVGQLADWLAGALV